MKLANYSFENAKDLVFEITLDADNSNGPTQGFGGGNNVITLKGLRASVDVTSAGMITGTNTSRLSARIWGMSDEHMNSASSLRFERARLNQNSIVVYAIDGDVKTLIFAGNFITAWANYSTMPNIFFEIEAQSMYYHSLKPQQSTSFDGEVDVATTMETFARSMGMAFEGNDVNVKLKDIALTGSWPEQAQSLAAMADINLTFDRGTLCIWPKDGQRLEYSTVITRQNGLIGYPTYIDAGISTNVLFNPNIVVGGVVEIYSDIYAANGKFYVVKMNHMLDSNMPNGRWFTGIVSYRVPFVGL